MPSFTMTPEEFEKMMARCTMASEEGPYRVEVELLPHAPENPETFRNWLSRIELALDRAPPSWDDKRKTAFVLEKMSPEAFNQYVNAESPEDVKNKTYKQTIEKLKKRSNVPHSEFSLRHTFFQETRKPGEGMDEFFGRMYALSIQADIAKMTGETLVAYVLLTKMNQPEDRKAREKLLSFVRKDTEKNMTFAALRTALVEFLTSEKEIQTLSNASTKSEVVARAQREAPRGGWNPQERRQIGTAQGDSCLSCGGNHPRAQCRFRDSKCYNCQGTGHIKKACKKGLQPYARRVTAPNSEPLGEEREAESYAANWAEVYDVYRFGQNGKFPFRQKMINVNGRPTHFLLDSGADISILPLEVATRFNIPLRPTTTVARTMQGVLTPFAGTFDVVMKYGDRSTRQTIYAHPDAVDNLLGCPAMIGLNIWQEEEEKRVMRTGLEAEAEASSDNPMLKEMKRTYPEVFKDGLGCCTKAKAHLKLKEGARPVFCRARPVPHAYLAKLEAEYRRLEGMAVTEPTDHTHWASPTIALTKPNGETRLCVDFSTGLNAALEDHGHPLPAPEDLFAMVPLDEESKDLCVMHTHRGLYRYQRLPFGIKTAPAIFQQIMDQMLAGLPFALCYLDDILIASADETTHRKHVEEVLQRIQDFGFRVKAEKCKFGCQTVKFLGFIIDQNGRRPDPAKIQAITGMPPPKNVSQLRSLNGMINHYQVFIAKLRDLRQPLDDLLKKDVPWSWGEEQQRAFEKCKEALASDLAIMHFNPEYPIIVSADASEYGIGAVIQHRLPGGELKAVAHASRSLTPVEKKYGQGEKEALALVYAVTKFRKMLAGRRFHLQTDHRPLLAIFGSKEGIKATSASRLQRWATLLLGYDFTLSYVNTTQFGQADALSRLIAAYPRDEEDEMIVAMTQVDTDLKGVLQEVALGAPEVGHVTRNDPLLQEITRFVLRGWPTRAELGTHRWHRELAPFYPLREKLQLQQNCLLYGDRVLIPQRLRARALRLLHATHPGTTRMKLLASSYLFWPGLLKDIERHVENCGDCQRAQPPTRLAPLHPWPATSRPLERVHMDFAGPIAGKMLLVGVDAFSHFPFVYVMKSTTAEALVVTMTAFCHNFGIPELLVTDNGPQFRSETFQRFCRANLIRKMYSPAYQPQSNGLGERYVQVIKKILAKNPTMELPTALQLGLSQYRNTPNARNVDQKSPAEAFFGRPIRSTLDLLKPVRRHAPAPPSREQEAMKRQYDNRHGVRQRSFHPGDMVWYRRQRHEQPEEGMIIKACGNALYEVEKGDGTTQQFHANQIQRAPNQPAREVDRGIDEEPLEDLSAAEEEEGDGDTADEEEDRASQNNEEAEVEQEAEVEHLPAEEPLAAPGTTTGRPKRIRREPNRLVIDPQAGPRYNEERR